MRRSRVTGGLSTRWRAPRNCLWMASTWLALWPAGLSAQSLRLSSPPVHAGREVSLNLSLTSPRGKEPPSALQWDIKVPARVIEMPAENPAEARAAGKTLSCREKSRTADTLTYTCLMFGGREPIADGVVAVLRLKIASAAASKPARIRIDQAIAVLKDATRIEMKPVETLLRISRK